MTARIFSMIVPQRRQDLQNLSHLNGCLAVFQIGHEPVPDTAQGCRIGQGQSDRQPSKYGGAFGGI
jgi:hypothetical protein